MFFPFSFILLDDMSNNGQASIWLCAIQGVLATLTCGLCCWLCASYSGTKPISDQNDQHKEKELGDGSQDTEKRNRDDIFYTLDKPNEDIGASNLLEADKEKPIVEESEEDLNEFEKKILKHLEKEEAHKTIKTQEDLIYACRGDSDWMQLNNTNNTYVHYLCNKIESEHKMKDSTTFTSNESSRVPYNYKTLGTHCNTCGIHYDKCKDKINESMESSFFVSGDSDLSGLNKLQGSLDSLNLILNNNNHKNPSLHRMPQHTTPTTGFNDCINSQGCEHQIMNITKEVHNQKSLVIHEEEEKENKTITQFLNRDTEENCVEDFEIIERNEHNHGKKNPYIDIFSKEVRSTYTEKTNPTYCNSSEYSFPTCNVPILFQKKEIEHSKTYKKHQRSETLEYGNEIVRENKKMKTEESWKEENLSLQNPRNIKESDMQNKIVDNILISTYTTQTPYNRFMDHSRNAQVTTHDARSHINSNEPEYKRIVGIKNKKNIESEYCSIDFPVTPLTSYMLEKSIDGKVPLRPSEQPKPFKVSEKSKCMETFEKVEEQQKMNERRTNKENQKNINKAIYEYLQNSMNPEYSEKKEKQEEPSEEKIKKQTKIEYISKEWMYKPNNILSNKKGVPKSKGGSWSFAQVKLNIDPCDAPESIVRTNTKQKRIEQTLKHEEDFHDAYNETTEENYQNETLEFEEMLQNIKSEYVEEETGRIQKNENNHLRGIHRNVQEERDHHLSSVKNEEQTDLHIMEHVRRSQRINCEQGKQNHQEITEQSNIQIYVKKEKSMIQKRKVKRECEPNAIKSTFSQNKKIQKIKYVNGSTVKPFVVCNELESLSDRELLIKICNQHREVDEYRCASGFANFLIQHMNNKKEESFADLLSFILKLKEEYKMTTPDFIEVFLILETINVDILRKYSKKGWLFVIIHFLKNKSMDRNVKNFMKCLRMDHATISNLTASFYLHKKEIHIEEKEVLRVLSILSDVVIRRSSRIKNSSNSHEMIKGSSKDKPKKEEEVLGSCWEPIIIQDSTSK